MDHIESILHIHCIFRIATTSKMVSQFRDCGIMQQSNQGKRNRTFVYRRYLDLLTNGTDPLLQ